MRNNKVYKMLITISAAAMIFSLAACGGSGSQGSSKAAASSVPAASSAAASSAPASSAAVASTPAASAAASSASGQGASLDLDLKTLYEQVAKTHTKNYQDLFKPTDDQAFATAEIFGIDRTGNTAKMYVFAATGEYVSLKGKAYNVSGGQGEAIFNIEYTNGGANLKSIDWSDSGAGHDKWVKNNFPKAYYDKSVAYHPSEDNGKSKLMKALDAEAERIMGLPVEQNNLLNIDTDSRTYEIVQTKESGTGADYKFETITIDKGKL